MCRSTPLISKEGDCLLRCSNSQFSNVFLRCGFVLHTIFAWLARSFDRSDFSALHWYFESRLAFSLLSTRVIFLIICRLIVLKHAFDGGYTIRVKFVTMIITSDLVGNISIFHWWLWEDQYKCGTKRAAKLLTAGTSSLKSLNLTRETRIVGERSRIYFSQLIKWCIDKNLELACYAYLSINCWKIPEAVKRTRFANHKLQRQAKIPSLP